LIYADSARLLLFACFLCFLRFGVLAFEIGKRHVQRFVAECESFIEMSSSCKYSRMNAAFMKAEMERGKAKPIDPTPKESSPLS
jgi:hypothetical protein